MPMGKGFAVTSNLDLARQLLQGYETTRDSCSPNIKLIAIANDAVATLVSFAYQFRCNPRQKAVMGLIVGTGCNATIPLALSKLRPSKRPSHAQVLDHLGREGDMKIVVNAEWGINGTAGPLRDLDFITRWDTKLDEEGEHPGFMPFEYMTAGRCLGELGRIIIVDYFTTHLSIAYSTLPPKLQQRLGLTTSFLGNLGSRLAHPGPSMVEQLEGELPPAEIPAAWHWTPAAASIVYKIARAIQIRAAGMVAAATVALLSCADEIQLSPPSPPSSITAGVTSGHTAAAMQELMVGYTGGCIMHFQDYLPDCQTYIDEIMRAEFGDEEGEVPRVVLRPCHDGGIIGAGILAATVEKTPLPPQPS
jgi:hexokinase